MNEFISKYGVIINVYTNFFIAIGTVGAVLVAIFGNHIRAFFRRPKISINIDTKLNKLYKQEPLSQTSSETQKLQSYTYNLKISNNGRGIAKDIQLTVDEIYKLRSDGQAWELIHHFFSTPFTWQNGSEIHSIWHKTSAYLRLIEVKEKLLDASDDFSDTYSKDESSVKSLQMELCLNGKKIPNVQLFAGTYIFEVKICTDNMKPTSRYIEIFLKGDAGFGDLESCNSFNIKEITKSKFRSRIGGAK